MPVRTYDPAQVIVSIGGAQMSGFADGSFVTVERDEDMFTKITGADGKTSRSKSNNKAGSLTLTLQQTSPSNDILQGFALLDELSNAGVVPVIVKDASGRATFFSACAWVRKTPNAEYAKEVNNREWVMDLADLDVFHGGNPDSDGGL